MNPIIKLFYDLGCDLTVAPANDYELALLIMKFIAILIMIVLFMRFLYKVMASMLGGKW